MCIMLNSSVLSIDLYSDRNLMLKECAKRKYAYVYPLSGHGFPIKSWDYIHRFFNEHSGGGSSFTHRTRCWPELLQGIVLGIIGSFRKVWGSRTNRNLYEKVSPSMGSCICRNSLE